MTRKLPEVAIAYDFDGTLSPGNMQEYDFIPKLGMTPARFWSKALGCPIGVRFGRRTAIGTDAAGLDFAQPARAVADGALGIAGAIYIPAAPPFEAFACA